MAKSVENITIHRQVPVGLLSDYVFQQDRAPTHPPKTACTGLIGRQQELLAQRLLFPVTRFELPRL